MSTCSHCGYEAPSFATCPLCGAAATGSGQPTHESGSAKEPAWEDPTRGFPKSLIDTWVESLFRPDAFFRGVPWNQAAARPLLYYLIITIIGAIFALWWSAAFSAMGVPLGFNDPEMPMSLSPAASALVNFFATPFLSIIALVLWSLLIHLLVALFARERRGFRATVRAICYGAGPTLLAIVPVLGALVGFFWSIAITGIGIRHAHRMTSGSAIGVMFLAVLIPFALLFMFFVMIFASLAAA